MKFLMAVALGAQPPDCPDDPERLASAAITVCAVEESRKLEPSGDDAGDVADATVEVCRGMLDKVAAMLNRCRGTRLTAADFGKSIRSRALREVVEIRARR